MQNIELYKKERCQALSLPFDSPPFSFSFFFLISNIMLSINMETILFLINVTPTYSRAQILTLVTLLSTPNKDSLVYKDKL